MLFVPDLLALAQALAAINRSPVVEMGNVCSLLHTAYEILVWLVILCQAASLSDWRIICDDTGVELAGRSTGKVLYCL